MPKTVLVADDEKTEVADLITWLKERYTVEYASSGKAAIERIKVGGLDAAILDWDMACGKGPQFDGDAVAKAARGLYSELVLVLRSSNANNFAQELEPLKIYCHPKRYGDAVLLAFLQNELGE
jgi:CheY-like chemotaxis protein